MTGIAVFGGIICNEVIALIIAGHEILVFLLFFEIVFSHSFSIIVTVIGSNLYLVGSEARYFVIDHYCRFDFWTFSLV